MDDRGERSLAEDFGSLLDIEAERQAAERSSQLLARRQREGFRGGISALADAIAAKGNSQLLPLLTSRAEQRAAINATEPLLMPSIIWRAGIGVGIADVLLERLKAPWHPDPDASEPHELWAANLREGLDGFARVAWCLRFGYTAAAAAIARKAFERWSFNIASSMELTRVEHETDSEYFTRLWEATSDYEIDRELGVEWATLSELIHGRSSELGGRPTTIGPEMQLVDRTRVHRHIANFSEVWLRQVRGAVCRLADEGGQLTPAERPIAMLAVPEIKGLPNQPDFLTVFWEPLLFGFVDSDLASTYVHWGETYRRIVTARAQEPLSIGLMTDWMPIEERWSRAIEGSRLAFQREREFIGEEFSPLSTRVRVTRYRVISEMADLVAETFADTHRRDAMRLAAAALESAWVIWLQDLDDSLTLARAVLENTARARAHRLKPVKALRMEGGPQSHKAPHRWAEAAGWGRLSPFLRALSEYSHVQANSRHSGSWDLLMKVQKLDPAAPAEHTARGHALERVAVMLAHEVSASLESRWPGLVDALNELVLDEDEATSRHNFEEWLQTTSSFKGSHDFGGPDYS